MFISERFSIFDVPLGAQWHDVTMQISWSASDATGWVRLWHNGVRQTFIGGGDTFFVRTLVPGDPTVYYKRGLLPAADRADRHRVSHRVSMRGQ